MTTEAEVYTCTLENVHESPEKTRTVKLVKRATSKINYDPLIVPAIETERYVEFCFMNNCTDPSENILLSVPDIVKIATDDFEYIGSEKDINKYLNRIDTDIKPMIWKLEE